MRWEYKIENGEATIIRCYGTEQRVEVPEMVDGYPVTKLADYVFSSSRREPDQETAICGGQLLEIILPPSLKKIGKYAFYGCFKLEKMTLHHRGLDIGGGAFTGCHHVKELCFHMDEAKGYCMKEILGELHHELKVQLFSENREICTLLFPEYYEEAVENTPARNVDMAFHGAGYSYRQCFQDGILKFAEYDKLFLEHQYLESEDFCIELALLRLLQPYQLGEDAKGCYMSWLMEHRISAAKWCITFGKNRELEFISQFIDWKREELDDLIREANQREELEMQSFLMDYKHRYFQVKKKTFDL